MRGAGAVLLCVECGRETDGLWFGWRAYLTNPAAAGADEGSEELVMVCPDCARGESGALDAGLGEP
jgi:hypothetical protein